MKDVAKRQRVMQRSMRLGHCICDPKKACPCDIFLREDVCLCAGERLVAPSSPLRLTRLVKNAGCASKIDQAALKTALRDLPEIRDPRVLVGVPAGDDAGVYRVDEKLALVQTVDVFCPSVDDPYLFGQIAAANSVSDVYAMGGRPCTALSIVGFPVREVPDRVLGDILRGGIDKMAEAEVAVIGGHSINDSEIKAGFAVTGFIDPARIVTNAGAMPGDALILTKPIGTGIICFAAQIDRAPDSVMARAAHSMASLNKTASELMLEFGANACTDVTGFSLIGHLAEMAFSSKVDVEITWDDVPIFPEVIEYVAEGIVPGAVERNRESSGERVSAGEDVEPAMLDICFDAQTSGGLLVAIPEAKAAAMLESLHKAGIREAAIIGKVLTEGAGRVFVKTRGSRPIPLVKEGKPAARVAAAAVESTEVCCVEAEPQEESCCAEGHDSGQAIASAAPGVSEIQRKFQDFMKTASAPGALDVHTKQAVAIALSVLARCGPCAKAHIKKARGMGFSQEEIDEAAWMAISFGGSPVMMFYNEVKEG